MNKKLKSILTNPKFVYLIFLSIMLFLHIRAPYLIGDDSWFQRVGTQQNIFDFLNFRWNVWTSRIIIEFILIILLQLPKIVWIILDSFVFLLIFDCLIKLLDFNKEEVTIKWYLLIVMLLLLPFSLFGEAGWYATTTNYALPLSLGLYTLVIMKKEIEKESVKIYEFIFLYLSIIISASSELITALLFGISIMSMLWNYIQTKKIYKVNSIILVLSIISLIVHLMCPGNEARTLAETANWYPAFAYFNMIDKIMLGVITTSSHLISKISMVTIFFFASIVIGSIRNEKVTYRKVNITLSMFISCEYIICILLRKFDIIHTFWKYDNLLESIPYDSLELYVFLIFIVINLLILVYLIYQLAHFKEITILIFMASICVRFIMGISPTIFASGERTYIFTYIGFICIAFYILNPIIDKKLKKV